MKDAFVFGLKRGLFGGITSAVGLLLLKPSAEIGVWLALHT